MVQEGNLSKQSSEIVAEMSLKEKAAFCSGKNFWYLKSLDRLELPSIMVTDGPHGLRKQDSQADHVGLNASVPATCFPTASALACSWNVELMHEIGVALGKECVKENVSVLLGPGINIKRHPLCGRNFEYFSEDPVLTGEMAASLVQGIQSQGVGASLKHYAVNNQERARMFIDAVVDERTLREIYLRGFEIVVKKSQPWTVMSAYNRVNGVYCGEDEFLLDRVLRKEWGFRGLVVTDWGATNDRVKSIPAGLDLEMPASGGVNDRQVLAAVKSGELSESDLDLVIQRNIELILKGAGVRQREIELNLGLHHSLAKRAAGESMVLLKNKDRQLPLKPSLKIAVIGDFAKNPRYQGAGSSQVVPTTLDNAFECIASKLDEQGSVTFAKGYEPGKTKLDQGLIQEAVDLARSADAVVLFVGLPAIDESEGFDREHLDIPRQQELLINSVCKENSNSVVVLSNGAPVTMPWVDAPGAILEGYLLGQAGGAAVADILFGKTNPSGKLAESFALEQQDIPSDNWFSGTGRQVQYREGLYVGYRYFDSANKEVLFPFGHGLSYTEFEYSNLFLSKTLLTVEDSLEVNLEVRNTGDVFGAEIVQVYVSMIDSKVYRPVSELKAFVKVHLVPRERQRVKLSIDLSQLAVFDSYRRAWVLEPGDYVIKVGSSSRDTRLERTIQVQSEHEFSTAFLDSDRPKISEGKLLVDDQTFSSMLGRSVPSADSLRPFHLNSSLGEIGETFLGNLVKEQVSKAFKKQMGANSADPTLEKMFQEMANDMPLRSLVLFSGGKLGFRSVSILISLLNRQFFDAIKGLFYLKRRDKT